MRSKKV